MNPFRMKSSSIFFKLAIAFLVIILPLSILSLLINSSSSRTVKSQIEQSLEYRIHTFVTGIDADFRRIMRLRNELLSDSDLQVLSFSRNQLTNFEYSRAVLRIQEKLRLLQASSLYLEDISVYLPRIQRNISSRGFVPPPTEGEVQSLKRSTLASPIVYWNDQYLIGGFYPESYGIENNDLDHFLLLKMTLSQELLRQSLEELYETDLGGSMLLQADKEWRIASGQPAAIEQIAHSDSSKTLLASMDDSDYGNVNVKIGGTSYKVIFEKSAVLNTNIIAFLPEREILNPLQKYRYLFWTIMLTSIFIVILFSYWIYRIIHQPIRRIVRAFFKLEQGNLKVTLKHNHNDEFGYLYEQFNAMSRKLQELVHEVYEEKIRSQRSELKQLQSQINPHFLYNSYFVLHRVAQMHDVDTVIRLTRHLGEYFRYITRNGFDDISLGQEYRHTKSYIEIQTMRYSRRIKTVCAELPEECRDIPVPKLILQPILENAYEHGLKDKASDGIVNISITLKDHAVYLSVEDNGEDLKDEHLLQLNSELQQGMNLETTGMLNVHRRLQLKYGKPYGLAVDRSPLGGLRVVYAIPIIKETHHVQASDH